MPSPFSPENTRARLARRKGIPYAEYVETVTREVTQQATTLGWPPTETAMALAAHRIAARQVYGNAARRNVRRAR